MKQHGFLFNTNENCENINPTNNAKGTLRDFLQATGYFRSPRNITVETGNLNAKIAGINIRHERITDKNGLDKMNEWTGKG